MLKAGDLIIARRGKSDESWWVMERDETKGDINSFEKNSHYVYSVTGHPPSGFEKNPRTSWASKVVVDQDARVVRVADITDEMYAKIAKYQLIGEP
jgi:hypothetical protein